MGWEARHRRAGWRSHQGCGAESRLGPPARCGALGTLPVLSVSYLEKEDDTSSVSRGLNSESTQEAWSRACCTVGILYTLGIDIRCSGPTCKWKHPSIELGSIRSPFTCAPGYLVFQPCCQVDYFSSPPRGGIGGDSLSSWLGGAETEESACTSGGRFLPRLPGHWAVRARGCSPEPVALHFSALPCIYLTVIELLVCVEKCSALGLRASLVDLLLLSWNLASVRCKINVTEQG